MTPKDMMLKTLRREGCEQVPVDFSFCPSQVEAFEKRFGHRAGHGRAGVWRADVEGGARL